MATLRRTVAPGSIAQARAVLADAADKLVLAPAFDTLVRALSPVLGKENYLEGAQVEEIFHDALERQRRLMGSQTPHATRHGRETHARSDAPPVDPWYQVTGAR